MCEDPCEWKFIEIAFGWGPGRMWLHTTLEDPWLHDMIFGGVLGRPLDTFFWALTISWSRLSARVWSGRNVHWLAFKTKHKTYRALAYLQWSVGKSSIGIRISLHLVIVIGSTCLLIPWWLARPLTITWFIFIFSDDILGLCGHLFGMRVLFGPFAKFSNFHWLDLHNKSCDALANPWWSIGKIDWNTNLPLFSYGFRKCMFVNFLTHGKLANCYLASFLF